MRVVKTSVANPDMCAKVAVREGGYRWRCGGSVEKTKKWNGREALRKYMAEVPNYARGRY